MAIKLKKVLISDPVDEAAIEILRNRDIQADVQTGLSKDSLIRIIPVCFSVLFYSVIIDLVFDRIMMPLLCVLAPKSLKI